MVNIGSGPNQEAVSVRDLNQAHIGRNFAIQHGLGTVYGQLAAVKVFPAIANLFLVGVSDNLQVDLDQQVYFHRAT